MSQNVPTTFSYNGVSYEYDIRDADMAEKFEASIKKMEAAEKAIPKDGKMSELIRANCKLIKDFFDGVLGAGAGNAVCTDKANLSVCYDAYSAFLGIIKCQKSSIDAAKNAFVQNSNRQQRRHPNKHHQ